MPGAHCVVVGCTNSYYRLQRWKEEFCPTHNINYGVAHCVCKPPFQLIPFPTVRSEEDGRKRWIKAVSCSVFLRMTHCVSVEFAAGGLPSGVY